MKVSCVPGQMPIDMYQIALACPLVRRTEQAFLDQGHGPPSDLESRPLPRRRTAGRQGTPQRCAVVVLCLDAAMAVLSWSLPQCQCQGMLAALGSGWPAVCALPAGRGRVPPHHGASMPKKLGTI